MRRALNDTKENLAEFIQQPDYCLLLVGATDADVPFVLKVQEQLAGEVPGSLYFSFGEEFVGKDHYALAIARRLSLLLTLENEQRRSDGRDELEDFPAEMLAPRTPAKRRILLAFQHMFQWLSVPTEQRVVLALMPIKLGDGPAYYEFMAEFAIRDGREPWMDNGRIIARDDRATHVTALALNNIQADGMLAFDVDFGTESMAASMAQDAVDPRLPLGERMQNFLQLAMIDMSYQRYDESIKKYAVLYEYYKLSDAPIMQALCLLGVGDCLRMAGQTVRAREKYQQGLALALQAKSPVAIPAPPLADGSPNPNPGLHPSAPPVLLNLALAAAEVSMTLNLFDDARSYFDTASRMAAKCMNAFAAADTLERKGDAEVALGLHAEALATWSDVDKIAAGYKYYERRESVLMRTQQLYESARMHQKANETRQQLDLVRLEREKASRESQAAAGAEATA
ncbi:MAG: hypothetical protein ACOY0T_12015 [Myxococcota bacterium]